MLDGEHVNGDAKTVRGFAKTQWGEEETDEMPLHYHIQFMHGLGITGRRRCIVSPMMGLDDVGTYWAEHDEEVIAAMREKAVAFWNDSIIGGRSDEHTSELQSLMRISYAVFCLKKKK